MLLALRSTTMPDPVASASLLIQEPDVVVNQRLIEGPPDTMSLVTQNFSVWRAVSPSVSGDGSLATGSFFAWPGPSSGVLDLEGVGITGVGFDGAVPPRLAGAIAGVTPHAIVQGKGLSEMAGSGAPGTFQPLSAMRFISSHATDGAAPIRTHSPVAPNVPVAERSSPSDYSTNTHYVGPTIALNWYGLPWEWDDLKRLVLALVGDVTLVMGQQTNIVGQEVFIEVVAPCGGFPHELKGSVEMAPIKGRLTVGPVYPRLTMSSKLSMFDVRQR